MVSCSEARRAQEAARQQRASASAAAHELLRGVDNLLAGRPYSYRGGSDDEDDESLSQEFARIAPRSSSGQLEEDGSRGCCHGLLAPTPGTDSRAATGARPYSRGDDDVDGDAGDSWHSSGSDDRFLLFSTPDLQEAIREDGADDGALRAERSARAQRSTAALLEKLRVDARTEAVEQVHEWHSGRCRNSADSQLLESRESSADAARDELADGQQWFEEALASAELRPLVRLDGFLQGLQGFRRSSRENGARRRDQGAARMRQAAAAVVSATRLRGKGSQDDWLNEAVLKAQRQGDKEASSPALKVAIEGARDIVPSTEPGRRESTATRRGVYCSCELKGKPRSRVRTRAVEGTSRPAWKHKSHMDDYAAGDALVFTVWAKTGERRDECLGTAELLPQQFYPGGFAGLCPLLINGQPSQAQLQVRVSLSEPGGEEGGEGGVGSVDLLRIISKQQDLVAALSMTRTFSEQRIATIEEALRTLGHGSSARRPRGGGGRVAAALAAGSANQAVHEVIDEARRRAKQQKLDEELQKSPDLLLDVWSRMDSAGTPRLEAAEATRAELRQPAAAQAGAGSSADASGDAQKLAELEEECRELQVEVDLLQRAKDNLLQRPQQEKARLERLHASGPGALAGGRRAALGSVAEVAASPPAQCADEEAEPLGETSAEAGPADAAQSARAGPQGTKPRSRSLAARKRCPSLSKPPAGAKLAHAAGEGDLAERPGALATCRAAPAAVAPGGNTAEPRGALQHGTLEGVPAEPGAQVEQPLARPPGPQLSPQGPGLPSGGGLPFSGATSNQGTPGPAGTSPAAAVGPAASGHDSAGPSLDTAGLGAAAPAAAPGQAAAGLATGTADPTDFAIAAAMESPAASTPNGAGSVAAGAAGATAGASSSSPSALSPVTSSSAKPGGQPALTQFSSTRPTAPAAAAHAANLTAAEPPTAARPASGSATNIDLAAGAAAAEPASFEPGPGADGTATAAGATATPDVAASSTNQVAKNAGTTSPATPASSRAARNAASAPGPLLASLPAAPTDGAEQCSGATDAPATACAPAAVPVAPVSSGAGSVGGEVAAGTLVGGAAAAGQAQLAAALMPSEQAKLKDFQGDLVELHALLEERARLEEAMHSLESQAREVKETGRAEAVAALVNVRPKRAAPKPKAIVELMQQVKQQQAELKQLRHEYWQRRSTGGNAPLRRAASGAAAEQLDAPARRQSASLPDASGWFSAVNKALEQARQPPRRMNDLLAAAARAQGSDVDGQVVKV